MDKKEKKVPIRKCVVTNTQHPKMEMFRVVRTPENEVAVDTTGKLRGHGVYVSKDQTAIANAKKRHILDRFLEVKVPDEIYDQLLEILEK
jgi:predicted RNA-binding protein YlxR (DUF448 family)